MSYYQKYIKYKQKYLNLKGGVKDDINQIIGISMAYFDQDTIKEQLVDGVRKYNSQDKIQIQDKFPIASISKSFLCEAITNYDNTLWNKPVLDILKPILKDIHKLWITQDIKVYNIANHTAGFAHDDQYLNPDRTVKEEYIIKEQEFKEKIGLDPIKRRINYTQWVFSKPPNNKIGEFHYSNEGYAILGTIIELLTGENYEQLIKKYIFDKLNLDANFTRPSKDLYGHLYRDNKWISSLWFGDDPKNEPFWIECSPCGAIITNTKNLAKYGQYILKQKLNKKYLVNTGYGEYGLGWGYKGNNKYHYGELFGYLSRIFLDFDTKTGLIFLTNTNSNLEKGDKFDELVNKIHKKFKNNKDFSLKNIYEKIN